MVVFELAFWMAAPAGLSWLCGCAPALWRAAEGVRRHFAAPRPVHPPLERIAADLRRIGDDLERLQHCERLPGHLLRLQAAAAAYDQTLLLACRVLRVPDTPGPPLSAWDRLQVEADLVRAGLTW
jgi:hypothetical protein